jgi:hypothetical protein
MFALQPNASRAQLIRIRWRFSLNREKWQTNRVLNAVWEGL